LFWRIHCSKCGIIVAGMPFWRRSAQLSPANVAADWRKGEWRTWPSPRNFIVGESRYVDALASLAGPPCATGYCIPVEVVLIREPRNQYDANAIRAEVRGRQVGYLARHLAAQIAPALDRARVRQFVVCGVVRGGWDDAQNFGVHIWLDRRVDAGPEITQADEVGGVRWPPDDDEISSV
jgi:HIRAN domain